MKEDTEELELTSGGREFHRRHDEGMKEEKYREEEQAGSSTVPVLRRLYSHLLFTDFGIREERQGDPWLFTSFQKKISFARRRRQASVGHSSCFSSWDLDMDGCRRWCITALATDSWSRSSLRLSVAEQFFFFFFFFFFASIYFTRMAR